MKTSEMFSLSGKTAIVTGAGKKTGLCLGMAQALNEAGAKVALWDVLPGVHALCEEMGGAKAGYYSVQADLRDYEAAEQGFAQAVELLGGRVDILLNGAGLQHRDDAVDFPPDKWELIIDVNLTGLFHISQIAGKHMIEKGGGKIINIASATSFAASRRIPAYAASKGGVMQLTKALSNEWAAHGVNVNAIAPGYMETELTTDMMKTDIGKMHTTRIPIGRWGKPEDLSGVVVFLASAASAYVSGAIIPVDGGYLGA